MRLSVQQRIFHNCPRPRNVAVSLAQPSHACVEVGHSQIEMVEMNDVVLHIHTIRLCDILPTNLLFK